VTDVPMLIELGWIISLVLVVVVSFRWWLRRHGRRLCAEHGHLWAEIPSGFWCPRCKHKMDIDEDGL
jgi:hypothetical protein